MPKWITKNGKHVLIYPPYYGIRSDHIRSFVQKRKDLSAPHKFYNYKKIVKKESQKKWYEEGWRKEIYHFRGTNYSIDLGNFGNNNFSFSVRKGDKEIFTVPKYLIKNAISCGFAVATGIPGCPFDVPLSAIEHAIKLYDQFTN